MYQNLSVRTHPFLIHSTLQDQPPEKKFLIHLSILIHTYPMSIKERQRLFDAAPLFTEIRFFRISSWPYRSQLGPNLFKLVNVACCQVTGFHQRCTRKIVHTIDPQTTQTCQACPRMSQASPRPYLPSPLGLKNGQHFAKRNMPCSAAETLAKELRFGVLQWSEPVDKDCQQKVA